MNCKVWFLGTGSAAMLALANQPAMAQDAPSSMDRQDLERQLAERDAIIANLVSRVEQLERVMAMSAPQARVVTAAIPGSIPAGANPGAVPTSPDGVPASINAEADRALERTLVQTGALLLPVGAFEIAPQFGFARQVNTAPTFITENDSTFVGTLERRHSLYIAGLSLRAGLPLDSQVEVSVPYQVVNQSLVTKVGFGAIGRTSSSGSGFGDVTVALAHTILHENGWLPDLVGRLRWNTGSGRMEDDGVMLGGGFASLGGSLSAIKRQDPLVFLGRFSYDSFFSEKMIDPGDVIGVSLGALLAASPETSLRFTFDQQFISNVSFDGVRIDGSRRTLGFLTAGASSLLRRGVLLDVAASFGLTEDSPDYALVVSLPIRF